MSPEPQPVPAATPKAASFFYFLISWQLGSWFLSYLAQGTDLKEGIAALLRLIFALLYLIDWSSTAQLAQAQKPSVKALKPRDLQIINTLTFLWSVFGSAGFFIVAGSGGLGRMVDENRRVYQETLQAAHSAIFWTIIFIAAAWGLFAGSLKFRQAFTVGNTPAEPKPETAPVDSPRE